MTFKMNHVHLKTQDPDKTAQFYVDTLGAKIVSKNASGGYRIDLVVEGANDARLAVECDGDKHAGVESWAEEVRRQRVLERAGWQFWRCFAASFTRRREAVLADLTAALAARGIQPVSLSGAQPLVLVEPRRVRMGASTPQPLAATVNA